MNFETLKRSHLKRNIIIGVIVVAIISAIVLNFTRAKYKVTQSIPLVNGTINYLPYDFKMIAMYQENDNGEYVEIEKMPSSGYIINEEKSYCEVNGEKDNNAILKTISGNHTFSNLQKGTKCYLYFDKQLTGGEQILLGYKIEKRNNFENTFTQITSKTVYSSIDWKGTSYYFAGVPEDNWVHFGGFYWRIIRINGDGSIRLIYSGTSVNTTGTETMINGGASQKFNANYDQSYYVGLSYDINQHGIGIKSSILAVLDEWYNSIGLSNEIFSKYIDSNVGFCSDRNVAEGYTWSAKKDFYYVAYERLDINKKPTLQCNSNDILQIPIGLITADEVSYAGGVNNTTNTNYYLYNGQNYWTMSPYRFNSSQERATMFIVWSNGGLDNVWVNQSFGVRPVINLKADTKFEGSGTSTDPFTIVE